MYTGEGLYFDESQFAVDPGVMAQFAVQPQAMPTAPVTPAPVAVPQNVSGIDVSAYGSANPDLVENWNAGGVMRQLGGSLEEALAKQYEVYGKNEIAQGTRGPTAPTFAVQPPVDTSKTGMVVDRFPDMGVQPPAPSTDPFAALRTPTAAAPNFGIYSGSASSYVPPPLMEADPSRGIGTPYYEARTNDGDFAGAVMVAPGQKVRLLDTKTGEVVFEGLGPEAAQQAVAIANAVSDDKGRKAAWEIQGDRGDGFVTMAYDRKDPKSNILGTVLDIAAPFILNALLPGVGGALAGALGSTLGRAATYGLANFGSGLVQGESLGRAATGALTSGATSALVGGVIDKIPGLSNAVNTVTGPVNDVFNTALGPLRTVLDPLNDGLVNIIDGAGNVVSSVTGTIGDARDFIRGTIGLTPSGGAGSVGPGDLNLGGFDVGAVAPVDVIGATIPNFGVPLPSGGAGGGGSGRGEIEGVDVVARPDVPSFGVPGPIDPGGLFTPGGNEIEGLEVRPPREPEPGVGPLDLDGLPTDVGEIVVRPIVPDPGIPVAPPFGGGGTTVDELVVNPPTPPDPGLPVAPPVAVTPPPTGPTTVPNPGVPSTGNPTGGGGGYGVPGNVGTRGSLSPIYTASLPAPTFGARTPRDVTVDQRYAIERPEASFFSNVPERTTSPFSVMSPSQARLAGVGDLNGDGVVDDADLILWRRRFGGQGYAEGGRAEFAVRGDGDGRSDSIPAELSDGEYVIDAETVALLGNGSSKAGADQLDKFRVAIRKHKGRDLAEGRFSAKARDPQRYLNGGRV